MYYISYNDYSNGFKYFHAFSSQFFFTNFFTYINLCDMHTYVRVPFYFKLSANKVEMHCNYTNAPLKNLNII